MEAGGARYFRWLTGAQVDAVSGPGQFTCTKLATPCFHSTFLHKTVFLVCLLPSISSHVTNPRESIFSSHLLPPTQKRQTMWL